MEGQRQTLEMGPFGITVEFLSPGDDHGGDVLNMDVAGRPRGFLNQRHVHPSQIERLEVLSGAMKVVMGAREHVLGEGPSIEVPAGTPHTQTPIGEGPGRVGSRSVQPAAPRRSSSYSPNCAATARSSLPATPGPWPAPS